MMLIAQKFFLFIFFLIGIAIFYEVDLSISHAQEVRGSIASALGGAGRAATEAEEGIFLNPAVLPHAKEFSSALFYQEGEWKKGEGESALGLSLIDNTEGVILPGGIGYVRRRRSFGGLPKVNEQYVVCSGGGFLSEHLSVGLSLHYRGVDQEGGLDASLWNGSLGLLWAPSPYWGLGLVWDHFLNDEIKNFPLYLQDLSELGLGGVYLFENIVRFRFDAVKALEQNPQQQWRFGFGIETFVDKFAALRLGVEQDERIHKGAVTAGLAFIGPRLKIDYSFRKNIRNDQGSMHGVDLRVPF